MPGTHVDLARKRAKRISSRRKEEAKVTVSSRRAGFNHYQVAACLDNGIAVRGGVNAFDAYTEMVSEWRLFVRISREKGFGGGRSEMRTKNRGWSVFHLYASHACGIAQE